MTHVEASALARKCAAAVLRILRNTPSAWSVKLGDGLNDPRHQEVLRWHWATGGGVGRLAQEVIENPRSIHSGWDFQESVLDGAIVGSIRASESVLLQSRTGNPGIFAVVEPATLAMHPSNHVLTWVLREALEILLALRRRHHLEGKYPWLEERVNLLEHALRHEVLGEVSRNPLVRRKPSNHDLRVLAKTRSLLYQDTLQAFRSLELIEEGDTSEIESVLAQGLVSQFESWEQFELATAIGIADVLEEKLGQAPLLAFPWGWGRPFASVGALEVVWQHRIPQREVKDLDSSEKMAREAYESLGYSVGDDRADLVITEAGKVLALIECKYLESGAAGQAVKDACGQLVSYARNLNPGNDGSAGALLSRSLIVVSQAPSAQKRAGKGHTIQMTDWMGLENGDLRDWVESCIP